MKHDNIEELLKYSAYTYNQIDLQEALEFVYKENQRLRNVLEEIASTPLGTRTVRTSASYLVILARKALAGEESE